jgi:hypothetical protein
MNEILSVEFPELRKKLTDQGITMTAQIESLLLQTLLFIYGKGWHDGLNQKPLTRKGE